MKTLNFGIELFFQYDQLFEEKKYYENAKNELIKIKNEYKSKYSKPEMNGNFGILAYEIAKFESDSEANKIEVLKLFIEAINSILKDNISVKILRINEDIQKKEIHENFIDNALLELIYELYNLFKNRYENIKKWGFTIISSGLEKEEINKKAKELLENYFKYDNSIVFNNSMFKNPFKQLDSDISSLKHISLPKGQRKAIIIKDGCNPIFSESLDIKYYSSQISLNKNEDFVKLNTFKTGSIPNIEYPEKWTISSLKDFFMKVAKDTRELPIYAIYAKIINNNKDLKESEELYKKLLNLYEKTPEKDDSFISDLIFSFNDQFEKMTINLIHSNIIFKEGVLPKKLKIKKSELESYSQYIISPKLLKIKELREKQWDIKKPQLKKDDIPKSYEISQFFQTKLHISRDNILGVNNNLLQTREKLKIKKKEEQNNKLLENNTKKFEDENIETKENINQGEIKKEEQPLTNFILKFKQKENKSEDKKDLINLNQNNDILQNNNHELELNIDTTNKKEKIKIDISNYNFNEEIILRLVIERMKALEQTINNKKPLPKLGIKRDLKGQPDYRNEKPFSDIYNVFELYSRGDSLANKTIMEIACRKVPFNDISINLLLDCSGFINIENKLKHFVIICGIVNALNLVNIPYAISLVADSQFQCTLKPFDVKHSIKYLQKLLDCLFIKRFIGKNANAIYYALNFIKNNTTNRVFLMFTDGLDEDFLLSQSWKDKLMYNKNFSFGFFFINSENIIKNHSEEFNYLKTKWNIFKKDLNDSGVNIELVQFNSNFDDFNKIYDNISKSIGNLLERNINEDKISNNDSEFYLPSFDLKNEKNLRSLFLFEEALKENYENDQPIYIKKTEVLKNIANKVKKLDIKFYKDKLSKIGKYEIQDEKIKNDIHSYSKAFIENRTKLNRAKIEAIFKPNKPSQKILSTTGTEFDIPALLMNLINPSPDPMIYLEEKGGMIRKYSVTLVIDTSYSCFNP